MTCKVNQISWNINYWSSIMIWRQILNSIIKESNLLNIITSLTNDLTSYLIKNLWTENRNWNILTCYDKWMNLFKSQVSWYIEVDCLENEFAAARNIFVNPNQLSVNKHEKNKMNFDTNEMKNFNCYSWLSSTESWFRITLMYCILCRE
jgi:hypothetical protein